MTVFWSSVVFHFFFSFFCVHWLLFFKRKSHEEQYERSRDAISWYYINPPTARVTRWITEKRHNRMSYGNIINLLISISSVTWFQVFFYTYTIFQNSVLYYLNTLFYFILYIHTFFSPIFDRLYFTHFDTVAGCSRFTW